MVYARLMFEEMEACTAAGMAYETYQTLPGSPLWLTDETPMCKCQVIMWYRYHKIVPIVLEDMAAQRARRR